MKKFILSLLTVFASLVFANTVFAENFYIENYKVDLNVNEDKSVQITENIDVQFVEPSHGIFRKIPCEGARINNVQVDNMFNQYYENGDLVIKIGDPDQFVFGKQQYNIQYLYKILDNKNEIYFNIIGTEWPVEIKNASFTVNMPKDFDIEKTGLSIGEYGTRGFYETAVMSKNGNSLYGEITQPLAPYNGITLRIEVPEGYFIHTNEIIKIPEGSFVHTNEIMKMRVLTLLGIIILTFISVFIWFKLGKDEHVTPIVTFYPPKNLNCLDAEIIYKEKASTKGLVALLIELAGKGYIQLEDNNGRFTISKIKEYDGDNLIEQSFLKNLFNNKMSKVKLDWLASSTTFYVECEKLIDSYNKQNEKIFYEANSLDFKNKAIIRACLLGLMFLIVLSFSNYAIWRTIEVITVIFVIFLFRICGNFELCNKMFCSPKGYLRLIALGVCCLACSVSLLGGSQFDFVSFWGIVGLIVSLVCLTQIAKKNRHAQLILSQLLGLKNFLEVAEKHRLKTLVAENPSYFYDILPYAYILGVSDKWIKKFEGIMTANPNWYSGSYFTHARFVHFTTAMHSATIPTMSNGGISSSSGGGGFSGGGFGGGGGGSW